MCGVTAIPDPRDGTQAGKLNGMDPSPGAIEVARGNSSALEPMVLINSHIDEYHRTEGRQELGCSIDAPRPIPHLKSDAKPMH